MISRIMASRCVHILVHRTCEYIRWQRGIKITDGIKADLKIGRSWTNVITRVPKCGRGKQKSVRVIDVRKSDQPMLTLKMGKAMSQECR